MLNFFTKLVYIFFLIISSTSFVYSIKLYAEKNKIRNLLFSILAMFSMLFTSYKLFQNQNVSLFMMTIFIKVLPIILLTIIDTLIFKTEMTLYKGLGVFLIIGGIFLMEMPKN